MAATNEAGRKHDAGKADYSLLPFEALEQVVRVLDFGANKYGRDNWKRVENAEHRYSAAAGKTSPWKRQLNYSAAPSPLTKNTP